MQVIVHTGAHFTDDGRLMKCLLRNKADFARRGVAVPGPSTYRPLLKTTFGSLRGGALPQDGARDVLIDAILDQEHADRMILSVPLIFGAPPVTVRHGRLYPMAGERAAQLQALFPYDDVELFMAIRNPAGFLPAIYQQSPREGLERFLEGARPQDLRWSDMVADMRDAAPDMALTFWCNEDTPLIWAQIIREIAALPDGQKITGGFDVLGTIMSREGMQRFRGYLKAHPVMSEAQKRKVMLAFLDKYAIEDEIEEELDLPGWTEALVEELTGLYDEDVQRLQAMEGVRLITP